MAKTDRPFLSRTSTLVGLLVLARLAFIACMPATWSYDVDCWIEVARVLREGGNPYVLTDHLHTAPFWPALIYVLDLISAWTGVSFVHCLQGLFILADAANLLLVQRMLSRSGSSQSSTKAVLLGLALSPISILLSAQHGNFDPLVATCLLLFIGALWSHRASGTRRSWLLACFFLGLGVFTKTVPLLLGPLLLISPWSRKLPTPLVGLFLLLAPTIIGLLPLYLVDAQSVRHDVFEYRSLPGWFGITGLLQLIGLERLANLYARAGLLVILALMASAAWRATRREAVDNITALRLALFLLLGLIVFGPGYSPQYIAWFLPLLVVLYALADAKEQRVLSIAYVVCTCTYVVEYALIPSHGAFLLHWTNTPTILRWSEALREPGVQTILRIPLFLSYLAVVFAVSRPLLAKRTDGPVDVSRSGIASTFTP